NGRDNNGIGEGMEGRLDFISQVYAQRRIPESRTHFLSRDAITPVSFDSAYVGPNFESTSGPGAILENQ
ncbi:hypothetical protein ALC57_03134, partial [Trachymyrmex cornetzi]